MDPKGRLSSEMHFLVPLGITYSDALHCGNTLDQVYQKESIQYDMTDLEGFRKVLNSLNKEDLVDVLADSYISSSGKKEKLVENILKNSTFLERIIKETVRESSKDALIEMCEHLRIESNASAPELKQQILQKLEETVDNKDLQNQIKFLNVALSFADLGTDDLADVLDDYDLPISGKKSDLIELIAKNDSVMEDV